jgi:hypothetical protein
LIKFKPLIAKIKDLTLLPKKVVAVVISTTKKVIDFIKSVVLKTLGAIWAVVRDLIAEMWTLLGMFIAWVTLEGSAKTVVGYATLIALTLWIISLPLRMDKED